MSIGKTVAKPSIPTLTSKPAPAPAAPVPSKTAPAPMATAQSSFQPASATRVPVRLDGGAPPPTTLRTERLGDGQANCLERASSLARPGDTVVLCGERNDPSGHAVVQHRDGSVTDPNNPGVRYPDLGSWQALHPQYQVAARIPQTSLDKVLSLPPGPQRDAAISRLGLSAAANLAVADEEPPRLQDPELVGLSNYSADDTQPRDPANPGPVERLQHLLVERGVLSLSDVEGNWGLFGPNTEASVKEFQRQQRLEVTGTITPETAQRLENPMSPQQLATTAVAETREQVRQQAIDQVLGPNRERLRNLPPEDRQALLASAQRVGEAAVRSFDRDMRFLTNDELSQSGISLRNMPPEDRAELEARASLAALERFEMAQGALSWSEAQMDPETGLARNYSNEPNHPSVHDDINAWNDYCMAFVSGSYGYGAEDFRGGSAKAVMERLQAAGRLQTPVSADGTPDFSNMPAGSPVFFSGGTWGHVAVFTGEFRDGEPVFRTSGWNKKDGTPGRSGISEMTLSEIQDEFNITYQGYVRYPDPNPNGF